MAEKSENLEQHCREAIAPIVATYLSTPSDERNETAFAKLILAALGELNVLTERAYEFADDVRACIVSSMTGAAGIAPEAEIIGALDKKGFIDPGRP